MPDLVFTFALENGEYQTYNMPPKSFLYDDIDEKTNMTICHLGIVSQVRNDMDHWILGQSFMENFYVTYDATDPAQLKIGISVNGPEPGLFGSSFALILAIVVATGLVLAFILLGVCICMRQHR